MSDDVQVLRADVDKRLSDLSEYNPAVSLVMICVSD